MLHSNAKSEWCYKIVVNQYCKSISNTCLENGYNVECKKEPCTMIWYDLVKVLATDKDKVFSRKDSTFEAKEIWKSQNQAGDLFYRFAFYVILNISSDFIKQISGVHMCVMQTYVYFTCACVHVCMLVSCWKVLAHK